MARSPTTGIISYNVKGLTNPIKRAKILTKLKKEKGKIIFLQETHLANEEHLKWKRQGFDKVYYSSYESGHRRGVAILISSGMVFEKVTEICDQEGRYVMVLGKLDSIDFTFLNVFAPPGSNWTFYKHIVDLMITESQGLMICAGDFNLKLDPLKDSSNLSVSSNNTLSNRMKKMMSELGICDVWRQLNPTTKDYSFYSSIYIWHIQDILTTSSWRTKILGEGQHVNWNLKDQWPYLLELRNGHRNTFLIVEAEH